MLHLLYGPAASGKTDLLMGRIRTAVAARTPGQVLLVPEQYSHEAERALCAACGDSLSLYAEVLSFTGLARRVAAETGAGEAPLLDQGGRLLCMALALSQVAPRLRLFGAAARRPQMQQTLLGAVDELKTACVTPDALEATAARCPGYQTTSFHDAPTLRQLLDLRPLPEFEAWMEDLGLLRNGRLTAAAGDASFFLGR